jgi:hypothetical protein
LAAAKKKFGFDPTQFFHIPDEVRAPFFEFNSVIGKSCLRKN